MDQCTTDHGVIGLATLIPEQVSIRDRLLATIPPPYFNCESQTELDDSGGARLVAEVVALDEDVLLSSNFNAVEVHDLCLSMANRATRSRSGIVRPCPDTAPADGESGCPLLSSVRDRSCGVRRLRGRG